MQICFVNNGASRIRKLNIIPATHNEMLVMNSELTYIENVRKFISNTDYELEKYNFQF